LPNPGRLSRFAEHYLNDSTNKQDAKTPQYQFPPSDSGGHHRRMVKPDMFAGCGMISVRTDLM
jgi:hypothetical protein